MACKINLMSYFITLLRPCDPRQKTISFKLMLITHIGETIRGSHLQSSFRPIINSNDVLLKRKKKLVTVKIITLFVKWYCSKS